MMSYKFHPVKSQFDILDVWDKHVEKDNIPQYLS